MTGIRTILRIALVCPTAWACAGEVAQPEPSARPASRLERGFLLTSDDVGLYYQKVGSGPALILPGRLFAFDDFRWLADEGYTLVSYDMRGRGRSESLTETAELTVHADVRDLEAVRRHFGVETFTAVGYSYLGLMVVLYALEHPERVDRIVQLGPVPIRFGTEYPAELTAERPHDEDVLTRLREARAEQMHLTHPREYCIDEWNLYSRVNLVGDPANVDAVPTAEFICSMPNEWPVNLARHFEHSFVSVQELDVPRARIRSLDLPVLTIHGRLDRNAPYGAGREWAMTLPEARLLTIERAAHQSFAEYPEIVRPAIRDFLEGRWPTESEEVVSLQPRS